MRAASLAACAALLAAPAGAADDAATDEHCAVWASAMMGMASQDPAADASANEGLALVMTWWVGRYEGRTGQQIDASWHRAVVDEVSADMPRFAAICLPQMQDFGARMQDYGNAVSAYGAALEAAEGGRAAAAK